MAEPAEELLPAEQDTEDYKPPSVASASDTSHNHVRYDEITDEDRAVLIDVIKNYPIIWDTTYEEDGKRMKQKEAFQMVVDEVNEKIGSEDKVYTVEVLRRVWKTLRECFSYYTGKRRTTTKKGHDNSNIKFKFFQRMSFLLKPEQTSYPSYEECISLLASNVNNGTSSLHESETSNQPIFTDTLGVQPSSKPNRKRKRSTSAQLVEINGKPSQKEEIVPIVIPNNSSFSNKFDPTSPIAFNNNNNGHYENLPQIVPCALSVNSTNNDLLSANLGLLARQFRQEINTIVMKYEDILIEREKQTL